MKPKQQSFLEKDIQTEAMVAAPRIGARLFRNNVAQAWVGQAEVVREKRVAVVGPGDVIVRRARPLHAGLFKGSADLIGVMPVQITTDHLGQTLGVFASVEMKRLSGGIASPEQKNWFEQMKLLGARAGFARSAEQAIAILRGEK